MPQDGLDSDGIAQFPLHLSLCQRPGILRAQHIRVWILLHHLTQSNTAHDKRHQAHKETVSIHRAGLQLTWLNITLLCC